MESGTFTCHKEGSACEPFAAVSDTDHAHGNDEEQPQREGRSVADLASEEMQGEEVQSEEQAESVDHASADLRGGVAQPFHIFDEGAASSMLQDDFDCDDSKGDVPDNNDDNHGGDVKDHDDSATRTAAASNSLREVRDKSVANLKVSIASQDPSYNTVKHVQDNLDHMETSDSSQQQSHFLDSSFRRRTSSHGCLGLMSNASHLAQVCEIASASDFKTSDSVPDLDSSPIMEPTVNNFKDGAGRMPTPDHDSGDEDRCGTRHGDSQGANGDHVNPWKEDETPPLDLDYEALKHLASTCLSHGDCIEITTLRRGGFHEIQVLHFEDGWSCIARFTRDHEMLCKTESELATIEYVRKHTSIPVPQMYFVNHNESHVVGSPFVLMERLQGQPLCNVWPDLTLEYKKSVIGQLASVLSQLAELKFDAIGLLKTDGTLGPLLRITDPKHTMDEKPFSSQASITSVLSSKRITLLVLSNASE
jgi:hypothetical protein